MQVAADSLGFDLRFVSLSLCFEIERGPDSCVRVSVSVSVNV